MELMEHAALTKHNVKNTSPCGKKFKKLKYFNLHVKNYHPALMKCSYCTTEFDRVENFTIHKCSVTQGKSFIEPIIQTSCLYCQDVIDIGQPFDDHIINVHSEEAKGSWLCFKCEKKFDNANQRRTHFNKDHGYYFCQICSKRLHIDVLAKH